MRHQMHMKVAFDERNYLLNRFPESFADLLAQVEDKVRRPLGSDLEVYFVDKDGDRIMVAEDADLANVREVCRLEGKDVCKLAVGLPEAARRRPEPLPASHQNCVDGGRYLAYLKRALPAVQEDFARCFEQGMPCEDCLGVGKTRDSAKCENCYGRGVRPLTKQMKIVMQYVDLRLQQLLLAPLEIFMASDQFEAERHTKPKDSSSSLEENLSKGDGHKQKQNLFGGGMFGREPMANGSGQRTPRKLSQMDDFNKVPHDD